MCGVLREKEKGIRTRNKCELSESVSHIGNVQKDQFAFYLHCDPAGHTVHTANPPVEYVPEGHGSAVSVYVEVQYIPGGHDVQDDCDPVLYVPDVHGTVVFRDIEGQE